MCKSVAPRYRQITTPTPHHSNFLEAWRSSWCPTNSVKTLTTKTTPEEPPSHHTRFTALFPGPPGWASARRELLDFMVQGKINRGRHIDHSAGHLSIQTNQCSPPPSPHKNTMDISEAGCLQAECHSWCLTKMNQWWQDSWTTNCLTNSCKRDIIRNINRRCSVAAAVTT